jgi:hypothetical protein
MGPEQRWRKRQGAGRQLKVTPVNSPAGRTGHSCTCSAVSVRVRAGQRNTYERRIPLDDESGVPLDFRHRRGPEKTRCQALPEATDQISITQNVRGGHEEGSDQGRNARSKPLVNCAPSGPEPADQWAGQLCIQQSKESLTVQVIAVCSRAGGRGVPCGGNGERAPDEHSSAVQAICALWVLTDNSDIEVAVAVPPRVPKKCDHLALM